MERRLVRVLLRIPAWTIRNDHDVIEVAAPVRKFDRRSQRGISYT